jgi:hypothetical protein
VAGQRHTAPAAGEEPLADNPFQADHLLTHGGLRHFAGGRSLAEAPEAHDSQKRTQQAKLQIPDRTLGCQLDIPHKAFAFPSGPNAPGPVPER